jgi:hypothetical protein
VVAALSEVRQRTEATVLTVREVHAEMVAVGSRHAEWTVFVTVQRMKAPVQRPPFVTLEKLDREGFGLASLA